MCEREGVSRPVQICLLVDLARDILASKQELKNPSESSEGE